MSAVFFGWKVGVAAFIVAMFGWGVGFYGPAVFLNVLHEQRGWPLSVISAAITVHFMVGAGTVANLASIHGRFGVARITRAGVVSAAVGPLY